MTTPMMVVAVLILHLASLPYAQLAQPDLLPLLLPDLLPPPPARRNLCEEPEFLWPLPDDLPMLFPWAT